MILWQLFTAFFKIGLFAVGGGLATVPFLFELSEETNWFSSADLVKMIAVSESTPGPLGVNMATFTGIQTAGVVGGFVATIGLVLPMLIVILIISHFLTHLRVNKWVNAAFLGLRPAVAMMILSFVLKLLYQLGLGAVKAQTEMSCAVLFCLFLALTTRFKGHPIFFILFAACVGIVRYFLQIKM